jgi:tetratricopeptide (TPR) repeat protein
MRLYWRKVLLALAVAALIAAGAWWWRGPVITLRVAVDESLRGNPAWRAEVERQIAAVSQIYRRQAGLSWRLKEIVEWRAAPYAGLDERRVDLRRTVGLGGADVLLGLTAPLSGRVASVIPLGDVLVVTQRSLEADRRHVLSLAHELAHLFGAAHGGDAAKGTLMDETLPNETFDARSLALIRALRRHRFRGGPAGISASDERRVVRALAASFPKSPQPEANAHHILGVSCLNSGAFEPAVRHLQEAVRIYPGFAQARFDLAAALQLDHRTDEAIAELRKLLQREPDNATAHAAIAELLGRRGERDDALGHAARALEIDPQRPSVHILMGSLLASGIGQMDSALAAFRKAVEIAPGLPAAHRALEGAIGQRNRAAAQAAAHRKIADSRPADPVARFNLGVALLAAGDLPGGRAEFERVLALNPKYAEAHLNLAVVNYLTQDYPGAWRQVRAARKLGRNPDSRFLAALTRKQAE